ncbi:site-specific DNA-methyltransferase [Clostridium sp. 3-3]|nr:site-specific DNA-methyltransferase [Clostridium sp. 3-3]
MNHINFDLESKLYITTNPPYNTGNDFVYPDDYRDNLENYLRITGQKDEDGNKISSNSEGGGRHHTKWLNMMYPRLRLARNLLSDDGVIFISIDDNEVDNLKKICNEIFGDENFINNISIKMSEVSGNKMTHSNKKFPKIKEYLLVYARNDINLNPIKIKKKKWDSEYNKAFINFTIEDRLKIKEIELKENILEEDIIIIDKIFEKVREVSVSELIKKEKVKDEEKEEWLMRNSYRIFRTASSSSVKSLVDCKKDFNPNMFFSVISRKEKKLYISKCNYLSNSKSPRVQVLFSDEYLEYTIGDLWTDISTTGLEFEGGINFKNGKKPLSLINRVLNASCKSKDIVLDFFSGSSTTAHAVMQLNAEDKGNRKFIMVQLPEECDEKSEAFKAGYKNICEIGKERIRRAGDKIVEENKDKEGIEDLDIGFKVFKLDTSNIKPWNPDYDNIEMTLEDSIDNFVPDRTQEDIVYEIMLKYGIDLTYPVKIREADGKKIFSIGFGALLVCLDDDITLEAVNEIVKLKEELNPETCRVVFKDNGFKTDSVKTNAVEILKRNDVKDIMSI